MKNIIDRIAGGGGAKIAAYLSIAVKSRLAVATFAALAAGGAWAAAGLTQTGYLSKESASPTAAFTGVAITDIAHGKYVLSGNIGGGNVRVDGAADAYNYSVTIPSSSDINSISALTVQFQRIDDGYCKCVEVVFTESSGTIYAYAKRAGYKAGAALGSNSFDWHGTVVTDSSTAGYGVYDLSLTLADRIPVAVWDGAKGDFLKTTVNGVTFDKNGGEVPTDGSYVKIGSLGAMFKLASACKYVVGEFTVKNLNETTASDRILASWSPNEDGKGNTVGSYLQSGGVTTKGIWASKHWDNASSGTIASGVTLDSERTFALATEYSGNIANNDSLIGTHLYELTGTSPDSAVYPTDGNIGLRSKQTYRTFLIGGVATSDATAANAGVTVSPFTDLEVTKVVLYASDHRQYTSGSSGYTDISSIENPTTATVANGEMVSASTLNAAAPICVYVEDGATLNLDAAIGTSVYFYGSISGTKDALALASSCTITTTLAAYVPSITGSGTVVYPSKTLPDDASQQWMTNTTWTGTVVLNECGADVSGTSGHGYVDFKKYGNSGSYIKAPGFVGYTVANASACTATLVIDEGTTFTLADGNSSPSPAFAKVSGAGTLAVAQKRTATTQYIFNDVSTFTGTISVTATSASVLLGGTTENKKNGAIIVAGDVTVKSGKTWSAAGGMTVNGSLTVESGATVPTITTSNTAQYNLSANATIGSVPGNSLASALFIVSGTLTVTDTDILSLTIPAAVGPTYYNAGTLDLSGCTALTTLYLDLGTCKTFDMTKITLPDGCMVYANAGSVRDLSGYSISGVTYLVEETKAEYGAGSLTVENVPTGASVAVKRVDGTIVSATVDGTTATLTSGVKIDGAATGFDATFTNTLAMAYSEISDAFINTSTAEADRRWEDGNGFYIRQAPWLSGGGQYFADHSSEIGIVVIGKMTPSYNKIFIHIGNSNEGNNGILILTGESENEVVIAYNNSNTVTPITKMTVPNAATARHVYVINKVDSGNQSIVTIYLDGIKWKTVSLAKFNLTSSSGVQVGSDFGGNIWRYSTGIYKNGNVTAADDTGVLNVLRVFGHAIGTMQVNAFTEAYPYVPPYGSAVRTFTAASETWVDTTENSTVWANTKDKVTTTSGTPASGAALTVNTDVATTIGVNLAESTSYEAITVNGIGATFQFDGESTGKITVTGSSVIGAPTTIVAGALDISGGPVTMTENGALTFNYSDYEVNSTTAIQLTGPIARNDSAVTITVPTNPYYTYTAGWDTSSEQYVITPTANAAVLIHGETPTGYATFAEALDDAVSGDTIDLTANVSTDSLSFVGSLTLTSSSAVTFTASGSIVLPTAASTLSVNGVTLSPAPTTTVAGSYVKATTAEGVTTYSVCANPSVSDVSFEYGADYEKATVTATVSDTTATYTLSVGNAQYAGTIDGSTVTFSGVATGRAAAYDTLSYSITAADGEYPVTVSGGSGSAVVADSAAWIAENATNTGTAAAGGEWATAVTYTEGAASIADNTFTAANPSTGDRVVLSFEDVVYPALSDLDGADLEGAQGAIAIGEVSGQTATTNFYVLVNEDGSAVWRATSVQAELDVPYDLELVFDYAKQKYSAKAGGTALSVGGDSGFALCTAGTKVSSLDFKGSGRLASINGSQQTGYMVKDSKGSYYATIAAAISAYASDKSIAPFEMLHAGAAPSGWKIVVENGIKLLVKAAKGFLMMAM